MAKTNRLLKFSLCIIMFLQVLCIVAWGAKKENFYWDEYYTLERAHYASDSTPDDHYFDSDEEFSYNKWIDANQVLDTLTVTKENSVLNDGVLSTVKKLFKPNSYSVFLNVLSAIVMPGVVSPWPSIILNIIFLMLNQIVLFFLAKRIAKNDCFAISVVAFYGFSSICISMTVFVRFYIMATLMVSLFTFFHCVYWDINEKNPARRLLLLLLAWTCMYIGYCNAPFVIFYGLFFFLGFVWILHRIKGLRAVAGYLLPIVAMAFLFVNINSNIIGMITQLNDIKAISQQPGAMGWALGQIVNFKMEYLPHRIVEMYQIIGNYLFGSPILFTAFLVTLIIGIFVIKFGQNRGVYWSPQYECIMIATFAFMLTFTAFKLYEQVRYISFVFPEMALIIMYCCYKIFEEYRVKYLLAVAIIGLQLLFVNVGAKVDMLYSGDKEQMQIVRQQDIDYIIMSSNSFMPFVLYQSATMANDSVELFVYDELNDIDSTSDLKSSMLVMARGDDDSIIENLQKLGYAMEDVGNTYYFKIFAAKR